MNLYQKVLKLLNKKDIRDISQSQKYSDLIEKLFNFFIKNKIFIQPKLA